MIELTPESWCTIFCNILIVKYVNKEHQENVIFVINILWENVRRTQICYKYDPNKNVIRLYTVEHENCHVTDPLPWWWLSSERRDQRRPVHGDNIVNRSQADYQVCFLTNPLERARVRSLSYLLSLCHLSSATFRIFQSEYLKIILWNSLIRWNTEPLISITPPTPSWYQSKLAMLQF